ncbi:hypothetical protein [Pedobacter sp.]|uniref:hypothetical protein n=1 Tax=Pedobacter sp. TaxID=1411316 RepID=UPI003D7F5B3A
MKKLKNQYRQKALVTFWGISVMRYLRLRNHCIRKFSTKQEKACYFQHKIELREYPVKLRKARGRALAHVNDDFPSYSYKLEKSWKHNSRRKNQWYREKKEPQ